MADRPEIIEDTPNLGDEMDSNATQAAATGGEADVGEYTRPSDSGGTLNQSRAERTQSSVERLVRRHARQQWQEEFPYHWGADDLITRRDTLRFLVSGTGALCLATVALAITGQVRSPVNRRYVRIASVGDVPVNGSKVFTYPDSYAQGILVNLPSAGLVAYSDVCTHLSCAVLFQPAEQRFYCPCHDGVFDAATGQVLAGPPPRPLPTIELRIQGTSVYAVEEVER